MEIVNQLPSPSKKQRLTDLLDELQSFVTSSAQQGVAVHEVEQGIWRQLLKRISSPYPTGRSRAPAAAAEDRSGIGGGAAEDSFGLLAA